MLSNEERARQFLPFDALNGFYKELKKREIEHEDKLELSEEQMNDISDKLLIINERDIVQIIYYDDGRYKEITDKVEYIEKYKKLIRLQHVSIRFMDIYQINI